MDLDTLQKDLICFIIYLNMTYLKKLFILKTSIWAMAIDEYQRSSLKCGYSARKAHIEWPSIHKKLFSQKQLVNPLNKTTKT